jgi:hypothetical protein
VKTKITAIAVNRGNIRAIKGLEKNRNGRICRVKVMIYAIPV